MGLMGLIGRISRISVPQRLCGGMSVLHSQRLHVGEDETKVQGSGAVDVPNAALGIDEEHTENVVQGSGRIRGVALAAHGLAVRVEDGSKLVRRGGREKPPFGGRLVAPGTAEPAVADRNQQRELLTAIFRKLLGTRGPRRTSIGIIGGLRS